MPPDGGPSPVWLGRLPYRWAHALQAARREAILAGRAPEALWLLEHDPVVTLGRRGGEVGSAEVEVVRTERGGLATWHGPGQLVGYLLIDVASRGIGVRGAVRAVEQGIADWLIGRGVPAGRRDGLPGVWVGRDKICAIGMHFRRGVSMHGFALNLVNPLDGFGAIVPCGITDGGVTTLARLVGSAPVPAACAAEVGRSVIRALVDTSGGSG